VRSRGTRAGSSTFAKGRAGEEAAAAYLSERNYSIVERNFRKVSGEVDIIAVEGGTIVFCEVKKWERMPIGGLEHALDRRKQGRIIRTSLWFLQEHPQYAHLQPRFDVLFVKPNTIVHLTDAFGEGAWYG
jgi:putative endonuclease